MAIIGNIPYSQTNPFGHLKTNNLLVLNAGNGWVAGGCWDDDITGDDWDHSHPFPTFSNSKTNSVGNT